MNTKITYWGNSLAVRLPKHLITRLGLRDGSDVVVSMNRNSIIVRPMTHSKPVLKDMLEGVTEKNIHQSIIEDSPQGKEVW